MANFELRRLLKTPKNEGWKKWGPYLSERQWGTVREDYSANSDAWNYTTHDKARSLAYRWGEEGIGGLCDNKQKICFALAFWNGKDPILKERMFGLSGWEGNHGEDVKELYYYLDSTPTHSYMKMLYKYPQNEFPYDKLIRENQKRSRNDPEYELYDSGILDDNEYFDIYMEYAKFDEEDILIKITVENKNMLPAAIHVLPTVWFRNTWSWYENSSKPVMFERNNSISISYRGMGNYKLYADGPKEFLFCDNETNFERLFDKPNKGVYCKDGINDYIVHGDLKAVNPNKSGTKASSYHLHTIPGKESIEIKLRFTNNEIGNPFLNFDEIFEARKEEADLYYRKLQKNIRDREDKNIQRQALAGMLWSKQFYYYDVYKWLEGDKTMETPPKTRKGGRNHDWPHLNNANVISMPDKWEYPWYAVWDSAFHTIPLAHVDPSFAKRQLSLFLREYYMHPNGQIPAYEWNFSDVNPPVHAWATWKVFDIDRRQNNGKSDLEFLERTYHKLLMNFTWWVNQKDKEGRNIFQGGFLGLDNIGVFDRSNALPAGGSLDQSDATSWMAMYCLNMLRIALELSLYKPSYQEAASKFLQHFLFIAGAMSHHGEEDINLWDEDEQFYFDVLRMPDGTQHKLKVRSLVGLLPLFAVEVISNEMFDELEDFRKRALKFFKSRPDLASLVSQFNEEGEGGSHLFSLLRGYRLHKILESMLDETEFLSDYGVRSMSKHHEENPYEVTIGDEEFSVSYLPAESDSAMFGGNSNWRGPIWFPTNYLIIESLMKFHEFYGNRFEMEYPVGSGNMMNLRQIAVELSKRLIKIFKRDEKGKRAFLGDSWMQNQPELKDVYLFNEYFNGDTGEGLGSSHQTGWTGLVADLIDFVNRETPENEPIYKDTTKEKSAKKEDADSAKKNVEENEA